MAPICESANLRICGAGALRKDEGHGGAALRGRGPRTSWKGNGGGVRFRMVFDGRLGVPDLGATPLIPDGAHWARTRRCGSMGPSMPSSYPHHVEVLGADRVPRGPPVTPGCATGICGGTGHAARRCLADIAPLRSAHLVTGGRPVGHSAIRFSCQVTADTPMHVVTGRRTGRGPTPRGS